MNQFCRETNGFHSANTSYPRDSWGFSQHRLSDTVARTQAPTTPSFNINHKSSKSIPASNHRATRLGCHARCINSSLNSRLASRMAS